MICEVWLLFYFFIIYKRKLVMLHYIFVEMDTGDFFNHYCFTDIADSNHW